MPWGLFTCAIDFELKTVAFAAKKQQQNVNCALWYRARFQSVRVFMKVFLTASVPLHRVLMNSLSHLGWRRWGERARESERGAGRTEACSFYLISSFSHSRNNSTPAGVWDPPHVNSFSFIICFTVFLIKQSLFTQSAQSFTLVLVLVCVL